jgi:hypothetical protein
VAGHARITQARETSASAWDVLGALGDLVGGIFAGGALLVASLVYAGQVRDGRRKEAAKVTISVDPPFDEFSAPLRKMIVDNSSSGVITALAFTYSTRA